LFYCFSSEIIELDLSENSNKIAYKAFQQWVEDNHALKGFNMTENLLLNIYSSLDPHKKGYLTFTDWEIAFSKIEFFFSL